MKERREREEREKKVFLSAAHELLSFSIYMAVASAPQLHDNNNSPLIRQSNREFTTIDSCNWRFFFFFFKVLYSTTAA